MNLLSRTSLGFGFGARLVAAMGYGNVLLSRTSLGFGFGARLVAAMGYGNVNHLVFEDFILRAHRFGRR